MKNYWVRNTIYCSLVISSLLTGIFQAEAQTPAPASAMGVYQTSNGGKMLVAPRVSIDPSTKEPKLDATLGYWYFYCYEIETPNGLVWTITATGSLKPRAGQPGTYESATARGNAGAMVWSPKHGAFEHVLDLLEPAGETCSPGGTWSPCPIPWVYEAVGLPKL